MLIDLMKNMIWCDQLGLENINTSEIINRLMLMDYIIFTGTKC